jgi:hypothetical protein
MQKALQIIIYGVKFRKTREDALRHYTQHKPDPIKKTRPQFVHKIAVQEK